MRLTDVAEQNSNANGYLQSRGNGRHHRQLEYSGGAGQRADLEVLLAILARVERDHQRFFQRKAQLCLAAQRTAQEAGVWRSKSTSEAIARHGLSRRAVSRYAQIGQLLEAASPELLNALEREDYWLDALRRKPSDEYLRFAATTVQAERAMGHRPSPTHVRSLWDATHSQYSPIIKPTDNWNFSPVLYRPEGIDGAIPGELYANCFWYFVSDGDVVVDPMAGSGLARAVYDDRDRWRGDRQCDFHLRLFDLTPRAEGIEAHDLLEGFPVARADYVFLDLPYWGMCKGVYSDDPRDLANMPLEDYRAALGVIARHCAGAQEFGKRCTVLIGNYVDPLEGQVVLLTEDVRRAWAEAGYRLRHIAYASRRIQQTQSTGMANLNNIARHKRIPLTDMVEVLTFERQA